MKSFKTLLMTIFCIFFFFGTLCAADGIKVGIVDFQEILEKSKIGMQAQAEIKDQGEKMEKSLKEKGAEIEELKKKFDRESLVIDAETKEQRERELRIKISDAKALEKKYQIEFRNIQARLMKRIRDQLLEIISEIGKNDKYDLILEKREGGVVYFPASIDITGNVIKSYNKKFQK